MSNNVNMNNENDNTDIVAATAKDENAVAVTRGDIVFVEKLDSKTVGREQHAGRPAVIISSDCFNYKSDIVNIVYLTASSKHRAGCLSPSIHSSRKESTAICGQVTAIDKSRISRVEGHVTDDEMRAIEGSVKLALQIDGERSSARTHKQKNKAEGFSTAPCVIDGARQFANNVPPTIAEAERSANAEISRLRAQLNLVQMERDFYRSLAADQMKSQAFTRVA